MRLHVTDDLKYFRERVEDLHKIVLALLEDKGKIELDLLKVAGIDQDYLLCSYTDPLEKKLIMWLERKNHG